MIDNNGRNELHNTGRGRVSGLVRMLVMFVSLMIVAAIAVFAYGGYDAAEDGLGGYIGQPNHIYQWDESYADYGLFGHDYESQCNNMMVYSSANSGGGEYSYQPGYLGSYDYVEDEYREYEAYQAYYSAEYIDLSGYAEGISGYIEDWNIYGGYIDYAPYEDCCDDCELEYYYVYLPEHGYVRRYMPASGGIQAYGGYIGIAPFSAPVLLPLPTMPSDFPSTNIIDVPVSVTTVPDIQTAITWINDNGNTSNAYRILLNFPGGQAIGTTTINFGIGHNIILDSYNGENQVWYHHATTRHITINSSMATVELRDVTLSRNLGIGPGTIGATTYGGGVQLSAGQLFMNHERATISNNRSPVGGAITISQSVPDIRFWIQAGQIEYNVATSTIGAGAIYSDGIGMAIHQVFTGGYVRRNISYGLGGAFSQCCWTWYWVDGTHIYENTADFDGGAFAIGGDSNHLYMLSGEIRGNTAHWNGGGIISGDANLSLVGGYICSNQAVGFWSGVGNGGGVYVRFGFSGNVRIFGGSIVNNQASGNGGGIHLAAVDTWDIVNPLNISGNRAGGNGGGLAYSGRSSWIPPSGETIILCDLVTISDNSAGGDGGGILINNSSHAGAFNMILRGATISNNGHATTVNTHGGGTFPNINIIPTAINTQRGGGVHIGTGKFRLDYGYITGNAALGTGNTFGYSGAIHAGHLIEWGFESGVSTAYIYINGPGEVTLNNNEARVGGAIYLLNQANLNDADNTGPINIIGNTATQIGGAIAIAGGNEWVRPRYLNEHWLIHNNTAGTSGGGIHIHNSTLTITDTTVTKNEVTGNTSGGGGVFVGGSSTFNIHSESLIARNTAYTGGGVLYHGLGGMNYGVFMHGGTIRNNKAIGEDPASHGGGGIAIISNTPGNNSPRLVMHDGYIINNTSYSGGGGVKVGSANIGTGNNELFNMHDGTISGNIARQGGGIYVASNASETVSLPNPPWTVVVPRAVRITGGEISSNQATTTLTAQYVPREVDPNTGAVVTPGVYNGSGGGIYLRMNSGVHIVDADITNNHAYEMGGGIFTEWYQYDVPTLTEVGVYTNITISDTTTFEYNTAGQGDFVPPTNAYDWTNIPGQAQGGTQSIHDHPINNYDINFRREAVTTIPFTFHKTTSNVYTAPNLVNIADITPFLLEGAYFSLFRFEGADTPPDFVTYPSANWERIYNAERSTGLLTDPITMELTLDGIYHLVETLAPAGFQVPFGQWRITHDDNAPGDFIIITVGGSAPSFEYLDGYFYVGNIPDFMLPLTGGFANNRMLWAGGLILMLGFAVWVIGIWIPLIGKSQGRHESSKQKQIY